MKHFNCVGCGACCRVVGSIPIEEGFPQEFVKEDGSCKNLLPDNKCAIYETRPLICKVNTYWKRKKRHEMSLKEWHAKNYEACGQLQKFFNIQINVE